MSVSVFLVEDEAWIRMGIKKMIQWEALDLVLVGEAEDGPSAKTQILDIQPQIIISDIRIPIMDGLELVRQVMREIPVKAIFISGYREFDYARQALTLDAVSYILKPVDAGELNEVLSQTIEKIRQEQEQSRKIDYGKDTFLINVLEERVDGDSVESAGSGAEGAHRVLLIPAGDPPLDPEIIKGVLKHACDGALKGAFFVKSKQEYVVIFSACHPWDFDRRTEAASKQLMIRSGSSQAWALGDKVSRLCDIPLSYNHAWIAYAHRDVHAGSTLLVYTEDICSEFMLPQDIHVENLRFAVETGDPEKAGKELGRILDNILASGNMGMQNIADCFFYISMDMICILQKEGLSTGKYYGRCREFLEKRLVYRDIGTVFDWFRCLFSEMAADVEKKRMKSIHLSVLKVREYIDLHYTENISLSEMAEMVYVNANYLSTSFKKFTGQGFVDYIIVKRMDKAAQILAETSLGVAETAQLVGYENVRHFSRLFKKYKGVLPSEYREASHKK